MEKTKRKNKRSPRNIAGIQQSSGKPTPLPDFMLAASNGDNQAPWWRSMGFANENAFQRAHDLT